MSTPTTSGRASTWVGVALGVVILGLVAAFAIGLPKTAEADADAELTLPDTLPGGYAAADDPASFRDGQYADQAEAIAKQERTNTAYGNEVLPKVLGTPAATRSYVLDGTKAVFVQVFRSTGGAFAPNSIPDPEAASGAPSTTMERVGDGACILNYQASSGQTGEPVFSQCQVTHDDLTVQIGASQVAAADLVDTADALLDQLQDQ